MFTKFQKEKMDYHFKIVDYNKDGFLTREDFYNHGKDYANLIKVEESGYIKKEIEWWEKMNDSLNISESRPITKAEHCKAFEIIMTTSCFLPVFLWDYMELIWNSLSLKNDDCLFYENFAGVMVSEEGDEAREIFNLLDTEQKGCLSIHELYGYWLNFFYSNNQACPSKWVFGKY